MTWLIGSWSDIHRITDRTDDPWFRDCKDSSGLYRLVALKSDQIVTVDSIARICRVDETGTIYLGASASLRGRISALVSTHDPRFASKKHKPLPPALSALYPPERLGVSFLYSEDFAGVFDLEHRQMNRYLDLFGEDPPLNS